MKNLSLLIIFLICTSFINGEGTIDEPARSNDPFLGEITMFAGNFAPRGWAFCNGQLLAISQYPALFSILGTTYGGDGRTSFALPDLRGRVPVHSGEGPGLSPVRLGQKFGTESTTLTQYNMPSHNHQSSSSIFILDPNSEEEYQPGSTSILAAGNTGNGAIKNQVSPAGGNQPINNYQPSQGINYIIALSGTFPSRS